MERDRRYHVRENVSMPISFIRDDDNLYYPATTYDLSTNGMSFESNHTFFKGECFFIKMDKPVSEFRLGHPYDACVARVKWCRRKTIDSHYKVGVQRLSKAKIAKKENIERANISCELCGRNLIKGGVNTDDHFFLCLNCFTHLSQLPGKILKSNLNRFMMGNII